MEKIIITRPEPVETTVTITFTESQFRGLMDGVLGQGQMKGAWYLLREAEEMLGQ